MERGRIRWRRFQPTPRRLQRTFLRALLRGTRGRSLSAVAVASVVPGLDKGVRRFFEQETGRCPFFISHRADLGFTLKVDRPREVGADRLADIAGALVRHRPPLIVIDSGTAVTCDVVNSRCEYIGGAIFPGMALASRALADHTAKLRKVSVRVPDSPLGTQTAAQIRAGIFFGSLGALERLIREYQKILGVKCPVIATGGLSLLLRGRAGVIDEYDPDLIFLGIHSIRQRNAARAADHA